MAELKVTITEIIEANTYPDLAVAEFKDRFGKVHILRDKLPVFSKDDLDLTVPREGIARCTIMDKNADFCTISLQYPDDIEDDEGEQLFEVDKSLVTEDCENSAEMCSP